MKKSLLKCYLLFIVCLFTALNDCYSQLTHFKTYSKEELNRPNDLIISKDQRFIYVASDYAINVFSRNDTLGTLINIQTLKFDDNNSIYTAKTIILSPDDKHIYIGCGFNLISFTRDENTGLLTLLQTINSNNSGGCSGHSQIVMRKDGKFLYSTSKCKYIEEIITFSRDQNTGLITFKNSTENTVTNTGIQEVKHIEISNNDKYIYVSSVANNTFTRYLIDSISGIPIINDEQLEKWQLNIPTPKKVTISDDNKYLYLSSGYNTQGGIYVIEQNDTTGFSINQTITNNETVKHINNVGAIKLSPDNSILYVASEWHKSVMNIFTINRVTGYLKHINTIYSDDDGFDGLNGCLSIDIDLSSRHLYVSSLFTKSVSVFNIDLFVNDTITACFGDTLFLKPSRVNIEYDWVGDTSPNTPLMVTESGTYTVNTNHYDISEEASIHVLFHETEINLGSDQSLNNNERIIIWPEGTFDNLLWMDGSISNAYVIENSSDTSYTLEISVIAQDNYGCRNSDTVNVYMNPLPIKETIPNIPISLYPNPTYGELIFDQNESHLINKIMFFKTDGQLVTIINDISSNQIDVSNLESGVYICEVFTENSKYTSKIIVK